MLNNMNKLFQKYSIFWSIVFFQSLTCFAQNTDTVSDDKILMDLVVDTLLKNHVKSYTHAATIQEKTEKIFSCDTMSMKIVINMLFHRQKIKLNLDTVSLDCKAQTIISIVHDSSIIKFVSKEVMDTIGTGYILSTPLFLLDRKYAIVELKYVCKPLCDRNEAYIFEKKGNKWMLLYKKTIFSS